MIRSGSNTQKSVVFRVFLAILIVTTSLPLFLLGCTKTQKLSIPEIPVEAAIGNKKTDLFFNKRELNKLGIKKGKLVAAVLVQGVPQIVLFNINTQKIKVLTKSSGWNRSPEFISSTKIVFCTGRSETSQLMLYDLKTEEESTLTGIDVNRYDPEHVSENKIIYNVFPKTSQFYLAARNLSASKETTLTISSRNHPGRNLAVRSAEPAYDRKNNVLYFVTDLAYEGKPKPLNIWKANLNTGEAEQLTHNSNAKVWEIGGSKVTSPQFYDLRYEEKHKLLYCVRFIGKHTPEEQPHLSQSEVHIIFLDRKKDEVIFRSNNPLRSPVLVTNKYLLVADPRRREIVLVNTKNEKDIKTFISNVDIVGDIDFFKD